LLDGAAIGNLSQVQALLDQQEFVNLVFLRVQRGTPAQQVIAAVRHKFPRLRATRGSDLISHLQLFRTVDMFAGTISLLALLASCLVVINTLLMAVWARTREIGILMAVGWSKARIVRSLIAEAMLLCGLAGLLGNLLAVIFLRTLINSGSAALGWVPVGVPQPVFWLSLGICGLLGLATGLYPAFVAAALAPAQALRCEH